MHRNPTKFIAQYSRIFFWGIFAITVLSGCASLSAVNMAGSALGVVLEATGVLKKAETDPSKITKKLNVKIHAGGELNRNTDGRPLSLVAKIYVLRSNQKFEALTYQQMASSEAEKEALAEELVSVKEQVLLPGKTYELTLTIPADAMVIGVAGLFRAPYQGRWKLAFDAARSIDTGITVGAHACALSASIGAPIDETNQGSSRSLIGVQCNG